MKNENTLELKIAKLLRRGVLTAAILIFIGWILSVDLAQNPFLEFQEYRPESLFTTMGRLLVTREWSQIISYMGLAVLISLPVVRVLLTGIVFLKQKDFAMAGIALLVLAGLLLSFSLGFEL